MKKTTEIKQNSYGSGIENPIMTVRVLFGMKSLGCLRFGICKIIDTDADDDTIEPQTAVANIETKDDHLAIHFFKKTIGKNDETYFANNQFIMGEDYELPIVVTTYLGLNETILLRGCYSLTATDDDTIYTVLMNKNEKRQNNLHAATNNQTQGLQLT
jgi:hypothetical protein